MEDLKADLAIQLETDVFGVRTIYETLCIMTYELGAINRNYVHAMSNTDEKQKRALLANSRIEVADLITQLRMYLRKLELDNPNLVGYNPDSFLTMLDDGMERQGERMKEWKNRRLIK